MPVAVLLLLSCTGAAGDPSNSGAGSGSCSQTWWYRDEDQDGWGVTADREYGCDPGPGWAEPSGDCDDSDPTVHPEAAETWYDGVDQDCSGGSDYDADGDGFDSEDHDGADCDDTDPDLNPDAVDVCGSGIDEDCDGEPPACGLGELVTDTEADLQITGPAEGIFGDTVVYAGDSDGDGFGEVLSHRFTDSDDWKHIELIELEGQGSSSVGARTIASFELRKPSVGASPGPAFAAGDTDLDGDGYLDDLVLSMGGILTEDLPSRVDLVYGPVSGTVGLDTTPTWRPELPQLFSTATTLLIAHDLDGDGVNDLVLSHAEEELSNPGSEQSRELLACGVTTWPEDSHSTVVVVEPPSSGSVELPRDADSVIYVYDTTNETEGLGASVIAGHDLSGDGVDDLLLGDTNWDPKDSGYSGYGRLVLFKGSLTGF